MIATAHPDYRGLPEDYVARAESEGRPLHTPHDLETVFSFHARLARTGSMNGPEHKSLYSSGQRL